MKSSVVRAVSVVLSAAAALAAESPPAAGDGLAAADVPVAPGAPAFDDGESPPVRQMRAVAVEYSHGDPTNEEQLLLELMNRARLDPQAEADRVFDDYDDSNVEFNVDHFLAERPGVEFTRGENRAAFRSYAAQPPFSFDAGLIVAARKHSEFGRQKDAQDHIYPGELNLRPRIEAEGYSGSFLGESVFNYAKSMLHCHAGFAIDWGQDVPDGESRPFLGHRTSLMNSDGSRPYVQVGVGVVVDTSAATKVGPRLVTIDFAQPTDGSKRFVTGVCFDDLDSDGFYDPGEGIAGARIESPASAFFTFSSASGGYALPVPTHAGSIEVTLTGDPLGPSAALGTQTVPVVLAGSNVKLDFSPAADPPLPDAQTFPSAAAVPLVAAGRTEAPIDVPAFDASSATVGEVDVTLDVAHPDASELRVALVSPSGTEVVLFDRGAPLAGLRGEFDATLTPVGDLDDFVGESYAGVWRLRVDDDATAGAGREIVSWSLRVRPEWVRDVSASRSLLGLTSFKAVDRIDAAPGSHQIRLAGVLDPSGRAFDPALPTFVRLFRGDGSEIVRLDLAALSEAGQGSGKIVLGARATSKATFSLRVKGLTFAEPLPSPLGVEVSIGGAIGRSTIPLSAKRAFSGKTTLPAAHHFRIDSIRSVLSAATGERTTTVKGRFAGGPATTVISGLVEATVGDWRGKLSTASLTAKGNRVSARTSTPFKLFVFDVRTGAFQVQVKTLHEPVASGVVPFSLRIGADALGAAEAKPKLAGTTLVY